MAGIRKTVGIQNQPDLLGSTWLAQVFFFGELTDLIHTDADGFPMAFPLIVEILFDRVCKRVTEI